jgi:hypothetical protein
MSSRRLPIADDALRALRVDDASPEQLQLAFAVARIR